jgi:hypothetical protein
VYSVEEGHLKIYVSRSHPNYLEAFIYCYMRAVGAPHREAVLLESFGSCRRREKWDDGLFVSDRMYAQLAAASYKELCLLVEGSQRARRRISNNGALPAHLVRFLYVSLRNTSAANAPFPSGS